MSSGAYLKDPNSYANADEAVVKSFHLSLAADFDAHVLSGHVDLEVSLLADGVSTLVLDSKTLNIQRVTCGDDELEYKLGDVHEAFGQSLTISLPAGVTQSKSGTIRVAYSTSPDSSAIQWLPPSQTAGKQHPYLFTQCQAIHARAMLPIQDTPGSKCPYTADITVPAPLVALMSALREEKETETDEAKGTSTFKFRQPVPMPSYLVALAIGALEKRDIGPRSAVWSEKEMVDAGAHEFADTEKFIAAAESIVGPYVWTRYDILLLPPSFPYGGMENPCLTFVTPTLLAGDRSLANVVAHEIAHSWMGNLVSPKTWEHFWMNEGFTVFLERKIVKAVSGVQDMHLHAIIGWSALKDSVMRYGLDHPYTVLNVKLDGVDPDDAFSSVPYEKGFNFLFYLEQLVGGSDVMDPFLRAHCDKFKFICTDSQEWREFFLDYFKDKVPKEKLDSIDWDAWYNKPGMPPVTPKFDTTLVDAANQLADDLASGKADAASSSISDWNSSQTVVFLERLQDLQTEAYEKAGEGNVDAAVSQWATLLTSMDKAYALGNSRNSEIRFRWLTLCVRAEMESAVGPSVEFLKEQGRMKFIRPLYRTLFKSKVGKDVALSTFQQNRQIYHNIASKMVAKDLGVE